MSILQVYIIVHLIVAFLGNLSETTNLHTSTFVTFVTHDKTEHSPRINGDVIAGNPVLKWKVYRVRFMIIIFDHKANIHVSLDIHSIIFFIILIQKI